MTEEQGGEPPSGRVDPRRNVIKGAKVVFNEGKTVMICRVRDLSDSGARLEFPPRTKLPDTFDLHVTGSPVRRCKMRWFKSNIAGVQFLGGGE